MQIFEDYLKIVEEINLENELDEENLEEAKFEYGGSTYSFAFGRYRKDGKEITRDEYKKASDAYKSSKKSNGLASKSSKEEPKEEPAKNFISRNKFSAYEKKKKEKEYLKKHKRVAPEPSDDEKIERNKRNFLMKEYLSYKKRMMRTGRKPQSFSDWSEKMKDYFFKNK